MCSCARLYWGITTCVYVLARWWAQPGSGVSVCRGVSASHLHNPAVVLSESCESMCVFVSVCTPICTGMGCTAPVDACLPEGFVCPSCETDLLWSALGHSHKRQRPPAAKRIKRSGSWSSRPLDRLCCWAGSVPQFPLTIFFFFFHKDCYYMGICNAISHGLHVAQSKPSEVLQMLCHCLTVILIPACACLCALVFGCSSVYFVAGYL